jgi:pectate lyase
LVGGSDDATGDEGKLNITWHHNWWADNVVERQPRVRFGKNHLFNNLWTSSASNYCVRAGVKAQILLESNVFSGVKSPQEFNGDDMPTANITAGSTNVYTNTTGTKATGGGGPAYTMATYAFTPDATSGLQAAIQSGAGPH